MLNFRSTRNTLLITTACAATLALSTAANAADKQLEYRVLATSKTSTMEKELNEAGAAGYRFRKAMGGKSANGGQEVIAAMVKDPSAPDRGAYKYRLLQPPKPPPCRRRCNNRRMTATHIAIKPSLKRLSEVNRWS